MNLYLNNTYLYYFESILKKIDQDERGMFIILDQTAFYPQGGGQPSDQGSIKINEQEIPIIQVLTVNEDIRHYINPANILITTTSLGLKTLGFINQDRRLINARYHTAAHLIGNVAEESYPFLKAIKGHSFPGEAYVEFLNESESNVDFARLEKDIHNAIIKNDTTSVFQMDQKEFEVNFYKLPYSIPENKTFRIMRIGNMLPVPCGGTHVSSLKEIGYINLIKMKKKNDRLRLSYEVT